MENEPEILESEVENILKKLKNKKDQGSDGIDNEDLK